jgi:heparan-alpha-glucosaminide N-acetyltransferase
LSTGHYVTLNALSSTATILFGVLAGRLLRAEVSSWVKLGALLLAGVGGLLIGLLLADGTGWIPLVKRIWTASFAVFAAGWTCLMLAAFYAVCDMLKWRAWAFPLVVVGMNSIAIYVSAGIFNSNIQRALKPFLDPPLAYVADVWDPVVMAAGVVVVQWLFCYWLYRNRIFFKV